MNKHHENEDCPRKILHKELNKKLQNMSHDQRFEYMVSAGIYTKNGKLTKNYRRNKK